MKTFYLFVIAMILTSCVKNSCYKTPVIIYLDDTYYSVIADTSSSFYGETLFESYDLNEVVNDCVDHDYKIIEITDVTCK